VEEAPKKFTLSQAYAFMALPFWRPFFHTAVRIPGYEGILLDTGAVENLTGSMWCERVEKVASTHGHATQWKDIKAAPVQGVGSGASTISKQSVLPICLADSTVGSFTTAVVDKSALPALMGLHSIIAHRIVLDPYHRRCIIPGPGGYKLSLSEGSTVLEMHQAATGHLLLPVTCWSSKSVPKQDKKVQSHNL
jgi:hypothetical protein